MTKPQGSAAFIFQEVAAKMACNYGLPEWKKYKQLFGMDYAVIGIYP
ncbi:MAG: hypothetical protein Q7U63_05310 [Polaromonas sp.]|nr:hypothetical protein [Polaromonas sp.]MDO9113197.1 hypothetical protein [Polaromonas sp.]MDP1886311.1 hypothetical protein [Polaromonas sp.]